MLKKRRFAAPFVVTLAILPACATTGSGGGGPTGPGGEGSHIDRQDDGTCWKSFDVSCPPDAMCNPPPPQQVDCATGEPIPEPPPEQADAGATPVIAAPDPPVQEEDAGADPGFSIDHRADNTCWKYFKTNCPVGARCNPPPPQRVDCNTHQPVEPSDVPQR
jgi:hypothetical protein